MKVLIIEDEAPAVDRLQKLLLEAAPTAQVAGITSSISGSVQWLQTHPAPDLILMDIELSDGQSFEIFQQTKITSPVIFTTSYDEFAIRAFKVNSIDYLLKPVTVEALRSGIEKISAFTKSFSATDAPQHRIEQLLQQLLKPPPQYRDRFLVQVGPRYLSIETEDIAYFYFTNKTTYLKTGDGKKYIVDYTLDELQDLLPPHLFFRANRQYMLHIRAVHGMHQFFNNKLKLALKPAADAEVLVSKEKAPAFKKWMGR
jgi:two-component system LytT family response regulator